MMANNSDPYRSPIKDYVWGSNHSKASQARLYQLLALYGDDAMIAARADSAAMGYLHYIHGVNPLGLVYLTNMKSAGAEHSASTMFHNWFAHRSSRWARVSDTTPGPPPGYLVGGPNPDYSKDQLLHGCPLEPLDYRCRGSVDFSFCSNSYAPPIGQPAAEIVSTVQRRLAGEFVGGHGAIDGLPSTLHSRFGKIRALTASDAPRFQARKLQPAGWWRVRPPRR